MYDMTGQPDADDRSPTLSVGAPNVLSPGCGCHPAYFRQVLGEPDLAVCNVCCEEVSVSLDVAPYLDSGERLVWIHGTDDEGHGRGLVLAYFVEELEREDDD